MGTLYTKNVMPRASGHAKLRVNGTHVLKNPFPFGCRHGGRFNLFDVSHTLHRPLSLGGIANNILKICGSPFGKQIMLTHPGVPAFRMLAAISVMLRVSMPPWPTLAIRCFSSACNASSARSSSGSAANCFSMAYSLMDFPLQGRQGLQSPMLLIRQINGQSAHLLHAPYSAPQMWVCAQPHLRT